MGEIRRESVGGIFWERSVGRVGGAVLELEIRKDADFIARAKVKTSPGRYKS